MKNSTIEVVTKEFGVHTRTHGTVSYIVGIFIIH